ncbi:MAG: ABC transporter substrate-binding protein [Desertimonas sp.]
MTRVGGLIAAVAAMAMAVAGCAADDAAPGDAAAVSGPAAATPASDGESVGFLPSTHPDTPSSGGASVETVDPEADRTYQDAMGRMVTVPGRPEHIVALSEPTLDGLLALGLEPVGVTAGRGQAGVTNYLADRLDPDVPVVAALAAPNYEAIAALAPDVIVVDGTSTSDPATIELLDDIAPTVYVSDGGEDWKTAFLALAVALGTPDAGEDVIAAYDEQISWAKAELGGHLDETVSIVRWGLLAPALILQELPPSRVIADLGFPRPPAQDREGSGHSEPVSLEELALIDGDWMFFGTLGDASGEGPGGSGESNTGVAASEVALERAEATPGFTALGAFESGHVVAVDGSAWMSAGGPIAAGLIVDDVVSAMVIDR